ncbi:MAG: ABC transporter permease [Nakamurella sp.]
MITTLRSRLGSWETILAILTIVLLVVAATGNDNFWTAFNIQASVSTMAEKALMVLPLALLIIVREIDISVASMAGLSAVTAGIALDQGGSIPAAIGVALITGLVCGAINGFFVAILGLPSLVVTLGTLALYRGMGYVLLGGTPISNIPAELISFGNDAVPGTFIPWDILPFLLLAPFFAIALQRMAIGRRIYALGAGPETASYSGVNGIRIKFVLFVITGVVCSIAGIVNIGKNSSAAPNAAFGFELDAITVVFLGGVSSLGGRGRMTGVYWALLLIMTLRSILQLQGAGGYTQNTAVGLLLIGSLLLTNIVTQASRSLVMRRAKSARLKETNSDNSTPQSSPT